MKMDHGLVIVAIPREDDYVWKVSSEKVPHMTLCYLGEPDLEPEQLAGMVGYVEHAATLLHRFWMSVDRRGKLGPKDADVLFFDKNSYNKRTIEKFRSNLLANDDINWAYQSATQHPDWTPHLTLGYPETPAKPDTRDYGFNGVEFDRIAIWTNDYEGPEFQLKSHESDSLEVAMSVEELIGRGEAFLEHYGVKGMKWGVQRSSSKVPMGSTQLVDRKPGKRVKVAGGKGFKPHEDAVSAATARRVATKSTTDALSNKELQALVNRLNLEQQFVRLNPTKRKKAQTVIKGLLGAGKTANEMVAFNNSPAGQQIRSQFNR